MNINDKRQKDIEIKCLGNVKRIINEHIDDKEYCRIFVEPQNTSEIIGIIYEVEKNEKLNSFPDFYKFDAFVEHFKISSSPIMGSNGSEFFVNKKQHDKDIDSFIKYGEESTSELFLLDYNDHSHDNLINSFSESWTKHIKKPKNTCYETYKKVFLLEYEEKTLRCIDDGSWYKLSEDKRALEVIRKTKDFDYVIFCNQDYLEIIDKQHVERIMDGGLIQKQYEMVQSGRDDVVIKEIIKEISIDTSISVE